MGPRSYGSWGAEILASAGVKAIYAEKAFAASLEEGQAVAAACRAHGVALNMGTNRRYDTGFDAAHELIHSGELGRLKSIVVHTTSSLFNGATVALDAKAIKCRFRSKRAQRYPCTNTAIS